MARERSRSPVSSSEDDDEDRFDALPSAKDVSNQSCSIQHIELLHFKPESVPESFSGILYGQRRTGKTTWLTWFLYCLQGRLDHIICFSATNFTGHYAKYMNPNLCYPSYNEEVMARAIQIQKNTPPHERKKVLVILDDVLDQEDLLRRSQALKTLFTMGRHHLISVVVCTQYAKCIPTSWRRNVDFACIFYTFSRDMSDIYYKEYGMLLSRCQFFNIMVSACKDFRALVIRPCTQSQDIREVYQLTKAQPHRPFTIGRMPKEKERDKSGIYD